MTAGVNCLATPLVEVEELRHALGRSDVSIVDASWYLPGAGRKPRAEFLQRHIPGAVFLDIDDLVDHDSSLPHMLPSPAQFSVSLAQLGIKPDSHVVVYDGQGIMSSARVWWMFRVFGHDRVSVLNGGLPAWLTAQGPVASAPADWAPLAVPAAPVRQVRDELVCDVQQLSRQLSDCQLLDARPSGRYLGQDPEPRPGLRSGHIPGSLNLPHTELLDPERHTFLPREALLARFARAGLEEGRAGIVVSCGSGVTACVLALALYHLGRTEVSVYDGSWAEWGGREDLPVATGR